MPSLSTPTMKTIPAKILVGHRVRMSQANNRSRELWQSFRPQLPAIKNRMGADFYSVQVYDSPDYFASFSAAREFERWATVEVSSVSDAPPAMEILNLTGGLYAMFKYRGTPAEFGPFARQIFGDWLPGSGYVLADRPHFEILTPAYRADDPGAEETICIPVENHE
ncbi:MAG: GyrI-like domain-containing protein [Turneriella sp.]